MKKSLFLFVATALAFASCTNDEYTGTLPDTTAGEGQGGEITFSGRSNSITRAAAEGATAAGKLDKKFNVFGVKKLGENNYKNVFAHEDEATVTDAQTYNVWWDEAGKNTSTSNRFGWEYVGTMPSTTGDYNTAANGAQTIKYWDHAASQYEFVAYARTKDAVPAIANVTRTGFQVTGTPDAIASLYVADQKIVPSSEYSVEHGQSPVKFTFRAAGAKVRLGVYETIPGYKVTAVKFYVGDASKGTAATLAGTFPSMASQTVNVTVGATAPTFSNVGTAGEFNFGTVALSATAPMKNESSDPTWAVATDATAGDYINVFPRANTAAILKVDYTLTSEGGSGETIEVYGATAAIHADYMNWVANHAYTYLFKISDNTNGSTGNDVVGLYPITFDAVVEDTESDQGTITTVSQPATITTYAAGSVSDAGITYTAATTPIYLTISDKDGKLVTPAAGSLKLYQSAKLDLTEADLISQTYSGDLIASYSPKADVTTVGGVTFPAGQYFEIPDVPAGTWYVEYTEGTSVSYKVIVVAPTAP